MKTEVIIQLPPATHVGERLVSVQCNAGGVGEQLRPVDVLYVHKESVRHPYLIQHRRVQLQLIDICEESENYSTRPPP